MTDSNAMHSAAGVPVGGDADLRSENLLRHYASILRRRWRWVVLGLVIGLVAGVASTLLTKKPTGPKVHYYKATNTLAQSQAGQGSASSSTAPSYTMSQAALLAQSSKLLDNVARATDLSTKQVAEQLDATVRTDVSAIDVTGIATDPTVAVKIANTAAENMRTMAEAQAGDVTAAQRADLQKRQNDLTSQRQQIEAAIAAKPPNAAALTTQLDTVTSQLSDVKSQLQNLPASTNVFALSVLQPASPIEINARGYNYRLDRNQNARSQLPQKGDSSTPSFDETNLSTGAPLGKSTRMLLGGAAGLVFGLISAFIVEAWDDRVRRRERVEELTGLGVLAEIPRFSRHDVRSHQIAVVDEPTSAAGERYRAARTAISFALGQDPVDGTGDGVGTGTGQSAPVVMVTSPGPSEGKTTTASNLAAAFADGGQRVLVIDGDFRRPAIRRFLNPVPNLVDPDVPCDTRVEGVRFLAGPHDAVGPDAAVASLRGMIEAQRSRWDLIILDTPPILTTNDAVDLLSASDAVVLVLRADKTRSKPARLVGDMLRRFQADALGVVLNSCDRAEMNEYYGYGYGYNYGYVRKAGSTSERGSRTVLRSDAAEIVDRAAHANGDGSVNGEVGVEAREVRSKDPR